MTKDLEPLATDGYTANLYPAERPATAVVPKLGICVSGGGSRALSGALGALSGLRALKDPGDPSRSLLERADYLSSVSGGSWASVLYTFLPATVGGKPVSDDDFLIQPVAPRDRTKQAETTVSPGNVVYMNPFCLGTTPQRFELEPIAKLLHTLHRWGFLKDKKKWPWFWIVAVGELILEPFDLYQARYDHQSDYPEPSRFFDASEKHITEVITKQNPSLKATQFYLPRDGRTPLYVNFNLLQNADEVDSPQIPIQATPIETGILGESPDGSIVGGGSVESFAFTSTLKAKGADPSTAAVTITRRYSLCDIAGCSSAFFAESLLQTLNNETEKILDKVEKFVEHDLHVPPWLAKTIVAKIRRDLDDFLDADAVDFIPRYNYWTLGEVGDRRPANEEYGFSDGGDFENTGILGLLARTDANRILAFINSESPMTTDPTTGQIVVAGQIPLLFGYRSKVQGGKYVSYGGMSPKEPMSYVQVFDARNGELEVLLKGLYQASCGDSGLGSRTAAFRQTLTTVDNPVAGIEGDRSVQVLWVYNNRVNTWQEAIQDHEIQADLAAGQAGQNPDGSPNGSRGTGPLANFPWYSTGEQIHLDKEAVNMLAQLASWNVAQLEGEIAKLLES